jgi:hypothetical protein
MPAFGDRVRIKEAPETRASGVAGLEGDVYGFTTPSVTAIEVVGGAPDDCAINVNVEPTGGSMWFRPDLLELIHHNTGLEVLVGNVRSIRQTDGSWLEVGSSNTGRDTKAGSRRSSAFGGWLRRPAGK